VQQRIVANDGNTELAIEYSGRWIVATPQSGFTWRTESFGCNETTQWSCRNPCE
jgi:hypothetical protein